MNVMRRVSKYWPLSWLLVLPLLALISVWGFRTVDMYKELGLRNLGDTRLGGMSLHKAGMLQFNYLRQTIRLELVRALSLQENSLPTVHLFVQDADLDKLDSERPKSGKQYVNGRLYNDGNFSRVKVRYRGDFAYHWGVFKRSFRVKTKRGDLFHGLRKFNLIAPKQEFLYGNHMGYEIAHEIGILAPRSQMINLNVNGKHRGIHLFVEQIGETMIRDSSRLPGDIYSGDEHYGIDIWHGVGQELFESPGYWEKVAYDNHYAESHNQPIAQLLIALKTNDQIRLRELIDFEAFAKLNLWEHLANSKHIDNRHNWRLYYDPGRGRFYPILWDGLPWHKSWIPEDVENWQPPDEIIASDLFQVLHDHPDFAAIKNEVFREFLLSDAPGRILSSLESMNELISNNIATDIAVLTTRLEWTEREESIHRMQVNLTVLTKILDHLSSLYLEDAVVTAAPAPESAVIWQGTIAINQDTVITAPVIIHAGTRITLADGASLFFKNKLTVNGTSTNPVTITPAADVLFGTVVVEGRKADGSRISGLHVSGGSGYRSDLREYSGMFSVHDVQDVQIVDSHFADNQNFDDQVHVVYSDVVFINCSFKNAPMDAVDLDMSNARVIDSLFEGNGNDGLDLMGATVTVTGTTFLNNGDKGVSVGERSNLQISSSTLNGNHFGIQVKDDSLVSANTLTFTRNKTAIDAYHKNWRYGIGGYGLFCGSNYQNNDNLMTFDKHSALSANETDCPEIHPGNIEELKIRLEDNG